LNASYQERTTSTMVSTVDNLNITATAVATTSTTITAAGTVTTSFRSFALQKLDT